MHDTKRPTHDWWLPSHAQPLAHRPKVSCRLFARRADAALLSSVASLAVIMWILVPASGCDRSNATHEERDASATDSKVTMDVRESDADSRDAHEPEAGPQDAAPIDGSLADAYFSDGSTTACDPAAPGTGLVVHSAPTFSVAISASTHTFRSLTNYGITHYPDGAVSFVQTGSGWQAYLAARASSYRLTGASPTNLSLDPTNPLLAPTGQSQDPHEDYAGMTSVFACGGALVALFHAEYHAIPVTPTASCPAPYHASMARALSADNGASFAVGTPAWVLNSSGTASYQATKCAYGAGGGSVFDPGGDYLYMYSFDWDASPQGIYLARTCRSDCGAPGTWKKYNGGSFSSNALAANFLQSSGPATAIIPAGGGKFDAFQTVSYNSYLDSYLMVVATESGFGLRVSADGIHWGARLDILGHVTASDVTNRILYPTLVDANTWSRNRTGRHLKLVHAMEADDLGHHGSHRAYLADLELTLTTDHQTVTYNRRILARYAESHSPYDHWCTTTSVTGSYTFEGNLGRLAANSIPGTNPIYDCLMGSTDHMVSRASTCEGGTSLGVMGFIWATAGTNRHAIYRCSRITSEGKSDHFVSIDSGCEGTSGEGLLGYVE